MTNQSEDHVNQSSMSALQSGGPLSESVALSGDFDGNNDCFRFSSRINHELPMTVFMSGKMLRSPSGQPYSFDLKRDEKGDFIKITPAPNHDDSLNITGYVDLLPKDDQDTQPQWVALNVFTSLPASVGFSVFLAGQKSLMGFSSRDMTAEEKTTQRTATQQRTAN